MVTVTDPEGEQNKHARQCALHIRGATAALKAACCIMYAAAALCTLSRHAPRLPQPFSVC